MQSYPKRLIEVDLPIARISAHARREKSIRHGHISTLHIWWARRPLAACRAVICASLWPDPEDLAAWLRAAEDAAADARAGAAVTEPSAAAKPEPKPADGNADADPAIRAPLGCKPTEGVLIRPRRFLAEARDRMLRWAAKSLAHNGVSAESQSRLTRIQNDPALLDDPVELRHVLLDFIADFANWDNSTDKAFLDTARALTQAAHEALGGEPGSRPLVVDPFAGGGSIPLEALRVGADAFASDLNPIPVLLNKVVLEYIPKYGNAPCTMKNADGQDVTFNGLAEAVRYWGGWIKQQAEKELAAFYPKDPDGATPIAYLWARTILSEAPGQGDIPVEVPLMRSLWLAKKSGRKRALRWVRDDAGRVKTQTIEVTHVEDGRPVVKRVKRPRLEIFEPAKDSEVETGTVARGSATCPVTGYTAKVDSVRAQLKKRRGGAADARLFCVVTTRPDVQGRFYRLPTKADQAAFDAAAAELARRLINEGGAGTQRSQVLTRAAGGTVQSGKNLSGTLSIVPDEPTPLGGGRGAGRAFSQRNYGMDYFADLFSPRQLLALTTLTRLVHNAGAKIRVEAEGSRVFARDIAAARDSVSPVADAVQGILACAIDRMAEHHTSLCRWNSSGQKMQATFGRQAIPMMWDFCEANGYGGSVGSWDSIMECVLIPFETASSIENAGHSEAGTAVAHPLPDDSATAFVTDPPYYDAVPYSDLSDFFYVWLKRTLPPALLPAFTETLTPKDAECIVDDAKGKDREFFERCMTKAMREGRRVARPDGVGVVVFAHKSTAGWETQLAAMIEAGWIITGSWPIDTEMGSRLRAMDSAALASSVHIVMRPREHVSGELREDDVGDWRDVLAELPQRIHAWMPRLAAEGVVGADAIFACLGPALEVFSRYSRVEKASGEVVTLGEYLEQVWAAVSKEALSLLFKDADATGLEPDARLTAMWLWTLGAGTKGPRDQGTEEGAKPRRRAGTQSEDEEDESNGDAGDDEDAGGKKSGAKAGGAFVLEFDAARKIAQGLGAHLEKLPSVVEIKGDKARLLSVAERTGHLFGKDAEAGPPRARRKKKAPQLGLFGELEAAEETAEAGGWALGGLPKGQTTLDRIHQAMILFAAGRGEAMKRLLVEDGAGKDAQFWKLAQSLSALYPPGTDEKRWVDGVLGRKKGLGL